MEREENVNTYTHTSSPPTECKQATILPLMKKKKVTMVGCKGKDWKKEWRLWREEKMSTYFHTSTSPTECKQTTVLPYFLRLPFIHPLFCPPLSPTTLLYAWETGREGGMEEEGKGKKEHEAPMY